ncbi:FecR family protein [Pedobacter heparinus]|uniref:FecR family protein n=1 Tax=Pedobacter heparinus TaxID=984 RepID=UPI0029313998|nr:FecR domain-containing protein [Pedobacter heparinus]
MDEQRIDLLSRKIVDGSITADELKEYNQWFGTYDKEEYHMKSEITAAELSTRIYMNIAKEANFESLKMKPKKLWPRIIGVAAAVAAIVFGIWFYTSRHPEESVVTRDLLANDIAPGKNTATIKIGDGEAITLSDKQTGVIVAANNLTYNDGSTILSSRANAKDLLNSINKRSLPYGRDDGRARLLTVTTPRGGTYQVTLPDGTKVWLNAASVLTYTMSLNERGGVRLVELSGEAYFEVFRNKNQPFVVTAKNLTTTVLGTHFNISAYDDEGSTKATLLEGSIRVTSFRGKRSDEKPLGHANSRDLSYRRDDGGAERDAEGGVILKPNQQALVTGSSGINVKEVDATEAITWKNGKFSFEREEMGSIMRKVARWYNVDVVFQEPLQEVKLTGSISRFEKVSKLLEMLENTKEVRFKIEGRKVYVTK